MLAIMDLFYLCICFRIKFDFKPVKKDTLVQIVPGLVHQTVRLTHVNTRTDHVPVNQDGRVLIVLLVIISHTVRRFTTLWWRFFEMGKTKALHNGLMFKCYLCNVFAKLLFC